MADPWATGLRTTRWVYLGSGGSNQRLTTPHPVRPLIVTLIIKAHVRVATLLSRSDIRNRAAGKNNTRKQLPWPVEKFPLKAHASFR